MEKREEALSEALVKNSKEVEKWERYINENTDAVNNMNEFVQHVVLDVMVPIGRKAIMYGQLIHTNEVLVGHYQGYFSKCSISKAKSICELRINKAKDHLKKLETECKLWKNNLEKPYIEGALPNTHLREIIENYDEEAEILWRQQHKINVRKDKLKEIEQRENAMQEEKSLDNKSKTDEEIFEMLEEAELEEELKQELEKLEINEISDETIRQLLNGEINLPSKKKRIAHNAINEDTTNISKNNGDNEENSDNQYLRGIVKITKNEEIDNKTLRTNNNIQPNPEFTATPISDEEHEDEEEDSVSKEFELIKKQAEYLNSVDQIQFLEYQIEIYQQKISLLKINTNEDICEKLKLLSILDKLEDFYEMINDDINIKDTREVCEMEEMQESEDVEETANAGSDQKAPLVLNNSKTFLETVSRKKKISFNLENKTLEFDNLESVSEMISKRIPHDIIKLDDNCTANNINKKELNALDKQSLRRQKIEDNLQYVKENQSCQDFDLVGQILKESSGQIYTLRINFQHSISEDDPSEKYNSLQTEKNTHDHPITPGDFYKQYLRYLEQQDNIQSDGDVNKDEYQMRIPLLKEVDRALAYRDPKIEFSTPNDIFKTKSILRNKTDTEKKDPLSTPSNGRNAFKNPYKIKHKSYSKPKKPFYNDHNDDGLSAYYKVMHDVMEKPRKNDELLPEARCIDTHAPRKRISRFKQIRQII